MAELLLNNLRDMAKLVQAYDKGLVTEREFTERAEQLLAWTLHDLTEICRGFFDQAAPAGKVG